MWIVIRPEQKEIFGMDPTIFRVNDTRRNISGDGLAYCYFRLRSQQDRKIVYVGIGIQQKIFGFKSDRVDAQSIRRYTGRWVCRKDRITNAFLVTHILPADLLSVIIQDIQIEVIIVRRQVNAYHSRKPDRYVLAIPVVVGRRRVNNGIGINRWKPGPLEKKR